MLEKTLLLKLPKKPRTTEPRVPRPRTGKPTPVVTALAWGVHLYTALGLVLASGIAVLLYQGGPNAFRWSFVLMAIATFVDATDGTLARAIRIKEVLPKFDGRKLDDITDFLTYTALPLLLIWRAHLLPHGTEWCLVFPLLASAYGFCQSDAKTEDGFFLGFPSLWNVVAFYLYALHVTGPLALATVLVLAFMTFVPSRYLYPTQPGLLNRLDNVLSICWTVMLGLVLWGMPSLDAFQTSAVDPGHHSLAVASLFYPAFYMGASWVVSFRHWTKPR